MTDDTARAFANWHVDIDAEGILWATADRAGGGSNVLASAVFEELDKILDMAVKESPAGLVVQSARTGHFFLGADITEFDNFTEAEEVTRRIEQGQAVFSRLENLACPTVAAVQGFCLGGGLELALACDQLLASNTDSTRFGFPEIKLGIFPGLGGVTRATEKIGGSKAMELMLSGRNLRAGAARGAGLVDVLVSEFASLDWACRRAIARARPKRRARGVAALTNAWPVRKVLAVVMRRKAAEKADPRHYPAPESLIGLWETARGDRERMFQGEARRVGQLMVGDTARNLRRVFFLSERLKGLGKQVGTPVRRVHVVGAGVMGGDIAAWCAVQGMEVSLQDRSREQIEPALERARKLFRRRLKTAARVSAAETRLIVDIEGRNVPRADVVIEAIFEDAAAKRELYALLEPRMAEHAVLATNTSALPLEELSRDLADPERLIGLHFFNPVAKMPLVEVVHTTHTDHRRIAHGNAFCTAINRFPLPVKSAPGFLVNRVLAPYMMHALQRLADGADKQTIDAAAVRFGMPVGPVELADRVGLDVCKQVAAVLKLDREDAARELLESRIANGKLGKKSGEGFYVWKNGKAEHSSDGSRPDGDELDALAADAVQPLLDACREAAADGIVEDDDLVDAGVIFGTGFAPYTGGPLHFLAHGGFAR